MNCTVLCKIIFKYKKVTCYCKTRIFELVNTADNYEVPGYLKYCNLYIIQQRVLDMTDFAKYVVFCYSILLVFLIMTYKYLRRSPHHTVSEDE